MKISSACEILGSEPQRFIDYVLADSRLRSKIVDKRTFADALEKVLRSDVSLVNIMDEIQNKGESLEICGQDIFDSPHIQKIIEGNIKGKKKELRQRVKKQYPGYTPHQINKETDRRLKIYIGTASKRIITSKQVTISESLSPVKVKTYVRSGQDVEGYSKTENKNLTMQEKMLLENGIRKGKAPAEVIKDYYQAGLGFRTVTSLRRHYYRLKPNVKGI